MKIYFLRHGQADWPDWDKPDDERPLTKQGRKEMERVGRFLAALDPNISLMLSSPLPRALQTAEIAAECLGVQLKKEAALGKGLTTSQLRSLLERQKEGNLMLVGHEPDFSEIIRELTGGNVKVAKASIAVVELETIDGDGRLLWLLPPRLARLLPGEN